MHYYIWLSFFALALLLLSSALACFFDHRKKRPAQDAACLSVIIPCFNDADTVRETIASVYSSWNPKQLEVLVFNDASTDSSGDVLKQLTEAYPIQVFHNAVNLGKTETLRVAASKASHDILLFMDADTFLNPDALRDMLERLMHRKETAAVSCPYQPANRGLLPRLQAIDYSMITVLQGAYNLVSGLALWGGCIAIKRNIFEQVGGFSATAITEDVELAFRLNHNGWRVEQSLVPVRSHTPSTLRAWIKQKIRWTAGGFQCLTLHPSVWMRNPLQVLLIALYSLLSINGLVMVVRQTLLLDHMYELVKPIIQVTPFAGIIDLIKFFYESFLVNSLILLVCFTILSSIYVIPLISKWRDTILLLMVIPFSLVYFPLYSLIGLTGIGYFLYNKQQINRAQRAW
jgi:cellulose synthase/poly-beta-1,6-N-acetylglucosamine synthase-like glycosyltransferase